MGGLNASGDMVVSAAEVGDSRHGNHSLDRAAR